MFIIRVIVITACCLGFIYNKASSKEMRVVSRAELREMIELLSQQELIDIDDLNSCYLFTAP